VQKRQPTDMPLSFPNATSPDSSATSPEGSNQSQTHPEPDTTRRPMGLDQNTNNSSTNTKVVATPNLYKAHIPIPDWQRDSMEIQDSCAQSKNYTSWLMVLGARAGNDNIA